jgi:putative DNA primase/helicase
LNASDWQVIDAFGDALAAAGLGQPEILADGKLHRFRTPDDKAGKLSGWYLLHLDRLPAGAFGSWKTGESQTWCANATEEQTSVEHADIRVLMEKARRQHRVERDQQQRAASIRAVGIWSRCPPALTDHRYLVDKAIRPHGARLDRHGNLVIPASDGEILTTLQFIAPDGSKRFLSGGRIAGCWLGIQSPKAGPILIGEGFATMATLYQETGAPVVIAFNATNLLPVAKAIRRMNPREEILICGDDDQWTPGNPGRCKARAAALEIGAKVLMPDFSGLDLSSRPTDWNDLYRLKRLGREVRT